MATTRSCVLCDRIVTGEDYEKFRLSGDAADRFHRDFPTGDPEAMFDQDVLCKSCAALPLKEREKLATKAIERVLRQFRSDFQRDN